VIQAFETTSAELNAALLQVAITLGIALYSLFLHRRYRKPYFFWFSLAWLLYVLRLSAIIAFLASGREAWLYWHQVVTGWTALALLWAALVFSRQLAFRAWYLVALVFPLGWSFVAIYLMDNFLFAAGPAVLFLSGVTAWTGWIFFAYWRRVRAPGAGLLALAFGLWAVHHLDYPFLRARGAWAPWGYYLDIAFLLGTAAGITVLVLDDLRRGFAALTALASGAARAGTEDDVIDALLQRAIALPAARGAALFARRNGALECVRGAGDCVSWGAAALQPATAERLASAIAARHPLVLADWRAPNGRRYAFTAMLPILGESTAWSALIVTGDARDPFAALDQTFLLALGAQIGAVLDGAELTRRLRDRTAELKRLSARMIQYHEDERRRLSRELHDETAQVFSALKLQLGLLGERADVGRGAAGDLERAQSLVDEGMRSIRNVTEKLRPAVLDELGLIAAMRSIIDDFTERCGLGVEANLPEQGPALDGDVELALYRGLQESLTNVLRHARARRVSVALGQRSGRITLRVEDDGRGMNASVTLDGLERAGRMGLAGMRDRVEALGGALALEPGEEGGTVVLISLPVSTEVAA
jgi:signal transduction histidine kinase